MPKLNERELRYIFTEDEYEEYVEEFSGIPPMIIDNLNILDILEKIDLDEDSLPYLTEFYENIIENLIVKSLI